MKSYFTIEELSQSETAIELGIDNYPDNDIQVNLQRLIDFLNPIRQAGGSAIIVTSGYRCPKLNKILGGSNTSAHQIGFAADLVPENGKMEEFKRFIVDYITENKLQGDQVLLEHSKTLEGIHIGLFNMYGKQRMQIKHMFI